VRYVKGTKGLWRLSRERACSRARKQPHRGLRSSWRSNSMQPVTLRRLHAPEQSLSLSTSSDLRICQSLSNRQSHWYRHVCNILKLPILTLTEARSSEIEVFGDCSLTGIRVTLHIRKLLIPRCASARIDKLWHELRDAVRAIIAFGD
jgi:hypothetical protein